MYLVCGRYEVGCSSHLESRVGVVHYVGFAAALIVGGCAVGAPVDPLAVRIALGDAGTWDDAGAWGDAGEVDMMDVEAPDAGVDAAPAVVEATCDDGAENGDESDVDCGGSECAPCLDGQGCIAFSDCESGVCTEGVCGQSVDATAGEGSAGTGASSPPPPPPPASATCSPNQCPGSCGLLQASCCTPQGACSCALLGLLCI